MAASKHRRWESTWTLGGFPDLWRSSGIDEETDSTVSNRSSLGILLVHSRPRGPVMNHRSGSLIAVGLLTSGAILLSGCSGSSEPEASAEGDQTPTPSSVETPSEESETSDEVIDDATADAEPSPAATDQERSFFVQKSWNTLGYPVDATSVLSDVTGDVPADQYTVTWSFDNAPDLDATMVPYRRYTLNPNVDFSDPSTGVGGDRLLCLERSDGYGESCTGFPDGFSMSLEGQFELYTQEFGPGGIDDPVAGTKEVLGSFEYTKPQNEGPLEPALCELTGGSAILDGENYVVTVEHVGECSSTQTWLGNVMVLNDASGIPVNYFMPSNISMASHDKSQTVLVIPQEEVQPWFDFSNLSPDDLNAFQVMSGSNEPGYEPSTIRIALQE